MPRLGSALFLETRPLKPTEGNDIWIRTRGGEPFALAALFLVAVDQVPLFTFVTFGMLNSNGNWVVPRSTAPSSSTGS